MNIKLTNFQKYILEKFYSGVPKKVAISMELRKSIWEDFKINRSINNYNNLKEAVPAIYFEMEKSLDSGRKIQAGVFSECVYSQAIAEKLELNVFNNHIDNKIDTKKFSNTIADKLQHMNTRYSYAGNTKQMTLLQAGGANEVDCALISEEFENVAMIELKEPYARTSQPDLPRYGEDGFLITTEKFEKKNPQFRSMLQELIEEKFNVFDHTGNNYHKFKPESIFTAVSENYSGTKFADFICTEDLNGELVLIATTDITRWAKLEGELRPTGRNSYKVWTPEKLKATLNEKHAIMKSDVVTMKLSEMKARPERGGDGISGWKISPMFFVKLENLRIEDDNVVFNIKNVKQNISDVTAKIDLRAVSHSEVQKYYLERFSNE